MWSLHSLRIARPCVFPISVIRVLSCCFLQTSDGAVHEMCGVLPFRTRMASALKMAYCKVGPDVK